MAVRIGLVILLGSAAAVAGVTVQGVTVQGVTVQGVTVQGVTVQGVTVQGVTVQGVTVQGVSSQGVTVQGVTVQGVTVQGVTVQGVTVQGVTVQGVAQQGVTVQGASLMGTDLLASDFDGVAMTSVEMRGTTAASSIEPHTLTSLPTMSVGPGNYIALASGAATNHYAVAHFVNAAGNPAQDLDLFIAGEGKDPVPNLLHNYDEQDNQDQLYVVYYFHKWSGEWVSLCPYNPLTQSASAMAIPEDPGNPNKFYFACTATGVASKCARNWGYKPWAQTKAYVFEAGNWTLKTFPMKPYYDNCKIAAMAGYCQNGQSFTKTGTQVDLFDTQQVVWPNTIENPWNEANPGSLWMNAQEYFVAADNLNAPFDTALHKSALQRSRYRELSPVTDCDNFAAVDRLEHDHIEDGRWGALFKEVGTLNVFSPTYCSHDEYHPGDALPWDCSPCTTQVCKTNPECCGSLGAADAWGLACIAKAGMVCNDGAPPNWPAGKVWPKDAPSDDVSVYPTFLLGPAGAVLRADGVSGSGSSATITGWACDPEWPGASVAVRFYAGGTADGGGTLLGEVRADQALAAPLASEVSAACDGPGRTYARHGFSFTLPVNQAGNVFVYAIDKSTANGPPAPATLLRNGAVQVPRCEHSEHVAGGALSASCSACASSVCNDGSHAACCTTTWGDDCAAAADSCAATDGSVTVNSRSFGAVTTGWIEAPTTGTYTFQASAQPSRLFINGTTVLDWFTNPAGMTSGTIELRAGHRYSFRWDRLQAEPPLVPGQGVTWQPPGTIGQTAIPSANLYAIAPGGTTGVSATYYMNADPAGFTGATATRVDGNIDINKDIAPPGPTPLDLPVGYGPSSYSATWDGEIIPTFSESYNFYVVGRGTAHLYLNGSEVTFPGAPASSPPAQGACAHDLCQLGPKLDSNCNSCAHDICAADPYCCNGGYLSYYSFQPEWDARCLAEVATYCPGFRCAPPAPEPPLSPEKKSVSVPLEAGVHYRVQLTYDNPSTDKTVRLLWTSPRTGKQAVPQFALQPPGSPVNAGSGLNVTYFATKSEMGVVKADGGPVGMGMVPDLSLTPTVGQLGTPQVEVLEPSPGALSGKPSPPSVVRPRYGEEVFVTGAMTTHITGIGGIYPGWVAIGGGGAGEMLVAVGANGDFSADYPVTLGAHTLKFVQLTHDPGLPCAPPNPCTESKVITWPVTVTLETASPKAPEILTPTDPTHTAVAAPLVLNVVGKGTSGPVHVQDLGSVPSAIPDIPANPDGTFSGQITLGFGSASDPNPGWHKLVFDQGGAQSRAVFVSVGIDPPTVEFPRNGAELDCEQPDQSFPPPARGTIPYPEDRFGTLRVMEETGRQALGFIGAQTRVIPPQNQGDPIRFESFYNPGPGRHVLVFFQAPDPPANATQAQIDEHFRAYSNVANTPTSRIVVNVAPPRFPIPQGLAVVLGGLRNPGSIANFPGLPFQGPLPISITQCGPGVTTPSPLCALPLADVNVRVGPRLYTTRANADGAWGLSVPLGVGWNHLTFSQVSDSRVGGAWSESCPSNDLDVGVRQVGAPVVTVPADIEVTATGPQGAVATFEVTATSVTGAPVTVDCVPPSGSMFPVGRTAVLCTATDPATGAVGLGELAVTVVDGPPTIFGSDFTAEADQPHGKVIDSYPIIAHDVVDKDLFLECVPPTPNLFLLDEVTPVTCSVTDHTGQSASTTFTVRVVDTTAPTLCPLDDIMVGTNAGAGAIVNYATCANDIVDGDVTPVCDHPSGSFFPFGTTVVTCRVADVHGNAAVDSFVVSVGDTTPPVLQLPTVVTAIATSRNGAPVSYTVTATDNVDPNPTVKCKPPSGSIFPIGNSTVTCKATDASGNSSQGTFKVRVIVKWSGLLPPIPPDGTGVFNQGSTIPVKFSLTGESEQICELVARLYVAPVDAAGNVGPEKPAKSRPPGRGNTFAVTGDNYHLNLDTGPMAVGKWQLRVDLGDGEPHPTLITLR